jgi:hypothetical protein
VPIFIDRGAPFDHSLSYRAILLAERGLVLRRRGRMPTSFLATVRRKV